MALSTMQIDPFMDAITKAVRIAIDKEVNEAVEEAQDRLSRRIPEIVAKVGLHVSGMIHVDRLGQEIRLTIIDSPKP